MRLPLTVVASIAFIPLAFAGPWLSHEPQRPLPVASHRPLPVGEVRVIDATRGDDSSVGTESAPWRTLDHALSRMPDGGVLCLRGGVHYSHAVVRAIASKDRPLILRSWPGELAILDGGEPAFATSPDTAWEPCADGVPGEFRSPRPYPVAKTKGEQDGDGEVLAMGRFIDSMIPLHGARFRGDLQSDNPWWNITSKVGGASFVYCGPAVWQDGKTGRIHCRLAHTKLPGLGADNYTGGTDTWFDPVRSQDIGAISASGEPWRISIRGYPSGHFHSRPRPAKRSSPAAQTSPRCGRPALTADASSTSAGAWAASSPTTAAAPPWKPTPPCSNKCAFFPPSSTMCSEGNSGPHFSTPAKASAVRG